MSAKTENAKTEKAMRDRAVERGKRRVPLGLEPCDDERCLLNVGAPHAVSECPTPDHDEERPGFGCGDPACEWHGELRTPVAVPPDKDKLARWQGDHAGMAVEHLEAMP